MKMDVSQNSPIIIHSDDEDEDDDVVLIKAEKAPENIEKKEEDDVIFISEEPSTSVQKRTSENKKSKKTRTRRSSSSSASDDDNACTIPQLRYFDSEFSSVSLVDDILRPLDLSQGTLQTTEVLPSLIKRKLTLLKPVQAACSSAAFPEQVDNTADKAVDEIEVNPVKILQDFDLSSGKDVDDSSFAGRSAKVDRFTPLKLPEGAEPLSSQTLNTPICRVDSGKECFNLCSQEGKNITPTTSNLLDVSSTSSQTFTDKSSVEEKQDVSAHFCRDNAKWDSPQGKLAVGTYMSSSSLAQDIDLNSPCDDTVTGFTSDLLPSLPAAPGDLEKAVPSILDQALVTPDVNPDKSHSSVLLSTNSYLIEVNSRPGTSKQLSTLSGPHVSQLSPAVTKLHMPRTRGPPIDNGSSLTLDINNLSNEDFSSLLNFFSDDDLVSSSDSGNSDKLPNESDQSQKGNNKIVELTSSNNLSQTDACSSSKVSSISTYSSSLTNVSEDLLTKSDPHLLDNNSSYSSLRHYTAGPVLTDTAMSEKSSSPTELSSKRKNHFRTLLAIRRRYSCMRDLKKITSPHSRCLSSRQIVVGAAVSSSPLKQKYDLAHVKKFSVNQSKGESDGLIRKHSDGTAATSASEVSDVSMAKTDPAQWRIVSLESTLKTCRSRISSLNDPLPEAKRRKLLEESSSKKPGLKIRLKLSPVISGPASHSGSPTQSQPSKIGLKKSIIRRHANMTGDHVMKEMHPHTTIHRSASEKGLKNKKAEGSDDHMLCVTCEKTMASRKLSKCTKGHGVCSTCLETQVKAILTGDVKQKNIRCPANACIEILSFDELKQALPSFVVDILEEKLDKEYLSYITKWMFTDEQLKSRSEFATCDTRMPPCPALSMRKYEEIYTQESRDPTEDLPTFWTPMERGAPVMVFEVVPDTEEYRALALQFHETLVFGDFDIVRIIRVQNPILWKYFALKRSEMVQENDGMDVAEKQLYHGTHRSTLEAIARKGFDWRLSGKHGTVYGCGSYFAKSARYSHGYTDRAGNGISVKAGSGPGRIIQPHMGLASLNMGFTTSSACYISRIHSRVHTFFNLPQTSLMPILPLPPMITSQNQPPQPPPAHYHLPAPPPAHRQMSSLQVLAHNQTTNSVPSKNAATGGPDTGSCGAIVANPPFVKILTVASTSSSLPVVPGPSVTRSASAQPKFTSYHSCLNSSQASFTAVDSQFSSTSLCPTQTASFQTQSSIAGSRNSYANPNRSVSELILQTSSMPAFSMGDLLGNSSCARHIKHIASSSSSAETKSHGDNKPAGSSVSTKLRAHERGTVDLTKAFTRDSNSETHFMFVARVLVGRHTGGKAGLKRPPPLDEINPFGKSYDSCVDDIFCPQVYVIFDSNQAYPEYVIEYNWHKD